MTESERGMLLAAVRKQVRTAYPQEPEHVNRALRGVQLALSHLCTVDRFGAVRLPLPGTTQHRYYGAIHIRAWQRRPSLEMARELGQLGFIRLTNHIWAYPLPRPNGQ